MIYRNQLELQKDVMIGGVLLAHNEVHCKHLNGDLTQNMIQYVVGLWWQYAHSIEPTSIASRGPTKYMPIGTFLYSSKTSLYPEGRLNTHHQQMQLFMIAFLVSGLCRQNTSTKFISQLLPVWPVVHQHFRVQHVTIWCQCIPIIFKETMCFALRGYNFMKVYSLQSSPWGHIPVQASHNAVAMVQPSQSAIS